MKTLRSEWPLLLAAVLLCAACQSRDSSSTPVTAGAKPEQSAPFGRVERFVQAWAVFGSAHVNQVGLVCAGRAELKQGTATVTDSCFTGDTNVVLCTNTTAANPVMCTPGNGVLAISGTGSDVISYARVR